MESEYPIRPAPRRINVLVVVDTDEITSAYRPNRDASHPKVLGHHCPVSICTDARDAIRFQATGKPRLNANIGDIVSIAGTSSSANSQDAVLLYSLRPSVDGSIVAPPQLVVLTRSGAVEPNPDSQDRDGLPPTHREASFSRISSTFLERGVETLELAFALYTLADDGQSQRTFGYYACHFVIASI
ncbi:AidA/PixA family protein [Paraburkholderia terricola]|uniref:Inclusion body protein n=1 Tax=Paraburkholderia terricola TaxID=169427 RepID=A0ABU1LYH0_9BURK|nr:AidA/PixA family protein [Paraburkholderia terricola]MDR6411801.1 hypothetical protein [Paraburkholderia terricola]MDR6484369.1 hypothetical protein [Paraburkholderia terricola]